MNVNDVLDSTNDLHEPLRVKDNSQKINIIEQTNFPLNSSNCHWEQRDRGKVITKNTEDVRLLSDSRYDTWPKGAPADGDYIQYGSVTAHMDLKNENWERYNYLLFKVDNCSRNIINPAVTIAFKNNGKEKIPDKYLRDGFHNLNLKPGKNQYRVDLTGLPRDSITGLDISSSANGSYLNLPGQIDLKLTDFKLAISQKSEINIGWKLTSNHFSQTQVGFASKANKKILVDVKVGTAYQIIDESQQVVFEGQVRLDDDQETTDLVAIADFSVLEKPGKYQIIIGKLKSYPFKINDSLSLWTESVYKVLNFIYSERCGYPVPGIHGICHTDVIAKHDGHITSFNGGWHDAGDLSQQTVHTGEVAVSLLEIANKYEKTEPKLAKRLVEEAMWGLDFVIKTRFGDGYRATSAGVSRWTDNRIGTMDDAQARVHNNPYENFLFAGLFAKASALINDSVWKKRLLDISKADFQFAKDQFEKTPYLKEPIMWEHTYNTSPSLYNATVAWAAGLLYQRTKLAEYLKLSEKFGEKLLLCQETKGLKLDDGTKLMGAFYRDANHLVFQHFNHQSRENIYGEALVVLSENNSDDAKWLESTKLYGNYLLYLQKFTSPYPMISSGIYRDDESEDQASFYKQNLLIDESAKMDFKQQLLQGVKIAPHLYIRRFPVWFSFRGNNGIILATGRSAAIVGQFLKNKKLIQLAVNQLQWLTGENPFSQSLIYGLGAHYESQYSVSSGEMIGEIPVGIETKDNNDEPYWPRFSNATYKEVWISNAGKWLSLIAEII
ncbi:glycoside hydrolase family 9 protein [Companilactobacillus huachuanensis]|uniref:Glycoside hydrolase family 9 protein n=1 Tax=Companilactobacillus huachuanensis TaxID=2559914 RepID=A0ABW1RQD7_9LACO|nr:glycoside hydrolase family 9 protein [Companilactobacillus huachuanensis]